MIDIQKFDGRMIIDSTSSDEILTLTEVKSFARITDTTLPEFDLENDALLMSLIPASYERFETVTGRFILPAGISMNYNLTCVDVGWLIEVPHVDITNAVIKFYDASGTEYQIDTAEYTVDEKRGTMTLYSTNIPTNLRRFNNLIITYETSLFKTSLNVSEQLRTALKQLITHWYENRQSVSDINLTQVPDTTKSIFDKYKRRKL